MHPIIWWMVGGIASSKQPNRVYKYTQDDGERRRRSLIEQCMWMHFGSSTWMLALPLTLCLTLSLSVSLTCSLLRRNNKKSVNLTPSSDARLSIFTVFVVWCWSGPEGEHHTRNPTNCLDNMYRQSRLIDRLQFYPIYICGSLVSVFSCPESIYI